MSLFTSHIKQLDKLIVCGIGGGHNMLGWIDRRDSLEESRYGFNQWITNNAVDTDTLSTDNKNGD